MTSRMIHVVDDDAAMRDSITFLLDSAGYSTRTYASGRELLDTLDALLGGCIITDVRMPDIDGLELLKRIAARGTSLPVVVMTGHGDVALAVSAMKLGAVDFIEKPFHDETLLAAITSALEHRPAGAVSDPAIQHFIGSVALLTPRERDVFDRLVLGDQNKEIARHLDISPRTVEIYRANVMNKTKMANASELVRFTVRAGLA